MSPPPPVAAVPDDDAAAVGDAAVEAAEAAGVLEPPDAVGELAIVAFLLEQATASRHTAMPAAEICKPFVTFTLSP